MPSYAICLAFLALDTSVWSIHNLVALPAIDPSKDSRRLIFDQASILFPAHKELCDGQSLLPPAQQSPRYIRNFQDPGSMIC